MDNISPEEFMNIMEPLFKEITGLDLHNHTNEEYQDWYHGAIKEEAETNPYTKEILRTAEEIIEERDYSQLIAILRNYDRAIQGKLGKDPEPDELPYWCYCCGFGSNKEDNNHD